MDQLVPEGKVLLADDDTIAEHPGDQVFGKGCHRDPVHSTRSHTAFSWGHKGVVVSVLVRFPLQPADGAGSSSCSAMDELKATPHKSQAPSFAGRRSGRANRNARLMCGMRETQAD